MTDFDYKNYSLSKLEEWLHDCMSSGEASPQEVYDTIVNVVTEQYNYYKDGASKTNELLQLLNGVKTLNLDLSSLYGDDHIHFNVDPAGNRLDFLSVGSGNTAYTAGDQVGFDLSDNMNSQYPYDVCGLGNTSDYCNNSWNSFWEEDQIKVDDQSHSDYWYDYDRNDSNRPNPFKDKVVKWQIPIERRIEDGVDDYYVQFPDDLLEAANLKPGDEIEWVDNEDGSYTLRKI